jgi:hypothetical protein
MMWLDCKYTKHNPYSLHNIIYAPDIDRLCGLVVRVPGYRSRGPGFDSWRYQIFWEVVSLERGPLSLVSITEELLEWKSSGSWSRIPRLTAMGIFHLCSLYLSLCSFGDNQSELLCNRVGIWRGSVSVRPHDTELNQRVLSFDLRN